jgi:hypothetical protein
VTGTGAGFETTYVSGLRYDVFGNRTRARYGNGVESSWSFDPLMVRLEGTRKHTIDNPGDSGGQVTPPHTNFDYRYTYDSQRPHHAVRVGAKRLRAEGPGGWVPYENEREVVGRSP